MILILMVEGARTCTPTLSCPEAPPCTLVSLTACRRRSLPWLPSPSRSRSSLPPSGSTPSGSEAPSWPPSPPSSRCGSPSRSTTSAAPPSSTASASKCSMFHFNLFYFQSNLTNCLLNNNKFKINLQFNNCVLLNFTEREIQVAFLQFFNRYTINIGNKQ